ncbi:MAG: SPASM domain-containing protein [Planctomycetaceae bacterium]|jgi:uncharacterized protein|nr:SPASM domain-containing protein [Planctomycetaceae bacterium]
MIECNIKHFDILPESFHVFSFHEDYLLFDCHSSVICEINEFTYDLFALIAANKTVDIIVQKLTQKYGECDFDKCVVAINVLKSNGFFQTKDDWQSIDNISFEPYLYHRPRRIQLMMAESCNLKCGYCYAWRNNANDHKTYMSWHVAKTAVDYLVWRSCGRRDLQVTFFGGEPLLNFKTIQKVVNYCKQIEQQGKHKFLFELITNGTLLTKEIVEYIVEHRFLLFISLDGWNEMHNYNRPAVNGSDLHDTILQNALYANKRYEEEKLPKIKIRANLTDKFMDLPKVAKYLESLGFTYIGIGAIEPLPHGDSCAMALSEEQMDELADVTTNMMLQAIDALKNESKVGHYIGRFINKAVGRLNSRSTPGLICGVCRNTAIVDNKGFIYPCHRYAGMEKYQVGNIFLGLQHQQVLDYYQKIVARTLKDCQKCWVRNFCSGGCPWMLSDKNGKINSPTEKNCNRVRKGAERGLWLKKELLSVCPEIFDQKYIEQLQNWDWADNTKEDN